MLTGTVDRRVLWCRAVRVDVAVFAGLFLRMVEHPRHKYPGENYDDRDDYPWRYPSQEFLRDSPFIVV